MLFPYPIQVNNSLLPTRVFTSFRIKMVVFRMILICDVVFGLVFLQNSRPRTEDLMLSDKSFIKTRGPEGPEALT